MSYRYKKERSVAFKIRHNPFSAGAPPRPRSRSSRRCHSVVSCGSSRYRIVFHHDILSRRISLVGGYGKDTLPIPTPRGTDPPSALAMRPPRIFARSTPMLVTKHGLHTFHTCKLKIYWKKYGQRRQLLSIATVKLSSLIIA